jgi:hypothetical protein
VVTVDCGIVVDKLTPASVINSRRPLAAFGELADADFDGTSAELANNKQVLGAGGFLGI